MAHVEEMLINGVPTPVTKFDNSAQDIDDAVNKVKNGFTAEDVGARPDNWVPSAEDLQDVIRTPIIQNGTWWVWDAATKKYVDTGVPASGGGGGTGNVSSTDIDTILVMDQEEFDALPNRPNTTIYAIRG